MSNADASNVIDVEFEVIEPTPEPTHLDQLLELQKTVNSALSRIDVFGSVDHTQGLAQHALADIKLKLDKLVDAYRPPEFHINYE